MDFNAVGPLEADIEGKYSQQVVDFPTIFVASNGLEFRSVVALKDALARVDKISLKQGPTELLAGYIQIPRRPEQTFRARGTGARRGQDRREHCLEAAARSKRCPAA